MASAGLRFGTLARDVFIGACVGFHQSGRRRRRSFGSRGKHCHHSHTKPLRQPYYAPISQQLAMIAFYYSSEAAKVRAANFLDGRALGGFAIRIYIQLSLPLEVRGAAYLSGPRILWASALCAQPCDSFVRADGFRVRGAIGLAAQLGRLRHRTLCRVALQSLLITARPSRPFISNSSFMAYN